MHKFTLRSAPHTIPILSPIRGVARIRFYGRQKNIDSVEIHTCTYNRCIILRDPERPKQFNNVRSDPML